MIKVCLLYENAQREEILLAGVPNIGHQIQLDNGAERDPLIVTNVLWMENEDMALISVRIRTTRKRG